MNASFASLARIAALALALSGGAALAQMLEVDSLSGTALRIENGREARLAVGDTIGDGALLRVADGAQLRLNLARHGFVDLGPGSELRVERLPFASYAEDLRTVFALNRGYLRIVWKHPQISTSWPLFVYMGDQRISLSSGEYFFEQRDDGRQVACVASGQASASAGQDNPASGMTPEACYRLYTALPSARILRDSDDWVAMRQAFGVVGLGEAVAEAPRTRALPGAIAAPPREPAVSQPPPVASAPADRGYLGLPPPYEPAASTGPSAPPARTPPPVSPPPRAGAEGAWTLVVLSLQDQTRAEEHARRLRKAGYRASTEPARVRGAQWYRVLIPGFASVAEARQVGVEIDRKLGYTGAWVLKGG